MRAGVPRAAAGASFACGTPRAREERAVREQVRLGDRLHAELLPFLPDDRVLGRLGGAAVDHAEEFVVLLAALEARAETLVLLGEAQRDAARLAGAAVVALDARRHDPQVHAALLLDADALVG